MKIAAIGRTETLYRSIIEMEASGHDVELIVTHEPADFYRRGVEDFQDLAAEYDCDFVETTNINSDEMVSSIREREIPVGISVNWRTLIGKPMLESFDFGIINFHAGNLPRYRGNAVVNWALLEGEEYITYTLHLMSVELDAGPILLKQRLPVTEDTKLRDIYDFAEENIPEMFIEAAEGLKRGTLEPEPQPDDPDKALRCYPRIPKDSEIEWSQPAERLDRLVRASSEPLFGAYTYFGTEKLTVWRAHAESAPMPHLGTPGQIAERRPDSGEVAVVSGDGFLVLEEVETDTHGRCVATEVIMSHRTRLGMDVTGTVKELERRIETLESQLDKNNT